MTFNPDLHYRRSVRLKDYDYSQAGAYFVTICTKDKEYLLGAVAGGKMHLNDYGRIAMKCWDDLPNHYSHIESDEFVIMPNHMHGVIVINNVGAGLKPAQIGFKPAQIISGKMNTSRAGLKPAPTPKQHGLSEIIRAFKTFSSRRINEIRNISGIPFWQRNYYEHIIRNEESLKGIREYIIYNPLKWEDDIENPLNSKQRKSKDYYDSIFDPQKAGD